MKPTPTERDNLVNQLVAARRGAGVKQVDVARRAQVARSYITKIETSDKRPGARILQAYSELCGLDLDALCQAWRVVPLDVQSKVDEDAGLWALVRAA